MTTGVCVHPNLGKVAGDGASSRLIMGELGLLSPRYMESVCTSHCTTVTTLTILPHSNTAEPGSQAPANRAHMGSFNPRLMLRLRPLVHSRISVANWVNIRWVVQIVFWPWDMGKYINLTYFSRSSKIRIIGINPSPSMRKEDLVSPPKSWFETG